MGMFISDLSGYNPLEMPELVKDRPKPFPVDALPGVMRDFVVELANSIPAPVDYAVFSAFGVLSSALVGKVIVQARTDYSEPVNLYLGLCGESGTAKSPPMDIASRRLRQRLEELNAAVRIENADLARQRRILEEKKRKAGDDEKKLDLLRQIDEITDRPEYGSLQQDITPEQLSVVAARQRGRACIYAEESTLVNMIAGATYSQSGVANIDIFLQGFDGKEVSVERKHGGSVRIKRATLSMALSMQPRIMERLTHSTELEDRGLTARFLFFMPEALRELKDNCPDISREAMSKWDNLVCELVNLWRDDEEPHRLTLAENARDRLDEYRRYLYKESFSSLGENSGLRAWARKGSGKVLRLAGLLALVENPRGAQSVELRHIDDAIAMFDLYFVPHARIAFGEADGLSNGAQAIINRVRDADAFNSSAVREALKGQSKFRGKHGKENFDLALAELVDKGFIARLEPIEKPKTSGRPPAPAYRVNPALHAPREPKAPADDVPF